MVKPGVVTRAPLTSCVEPESVKAPVLVSSLTSVDICSEILPWAQHHRRKGEADAEILELDRHVALGCRGLRAQGIDHRRGTAPFHTGNGRQVRLSKNVNQADLVERLQHTLNVVVG